MKLLLFSDLHCDTLAASQLVERSHNFDVIVCAGDLANCRRRLNLCMDVLRQIVKPILLVPGNNESFEELIQTSAGWTSAHVLHGTGVRIEGIDFFGLGGGIPTTPFGDWSYDFTEQEAAVLLADCPTGGVLICHSPPKGAVDVASNGKSLGSTAIRTAVEKRAPKLVVCGHIHASGGQTATIGPSTVINAGPGGMEWNLA